MMKLLIKNCKIENNFFKIDRWIFLGNGMVLLHCYNVQLCNITVYKSKQWYGSTILAVNVLGISSFINVSSHGLIVELVKLVILLIVIPTAELHWMMTVSSVVPLAVLSMSEML